MPRVRDETVTPHPRLSEAFGAGDDRISVDCGAILPTNSDEGQARGARCCAPCARSAACEVLDSGSDGAYEDTRGESTRSVRSVRAIPETRAGQEPSPCERYRQIDTAVTLRARDEGTFITYPTNRVVGTVGDADKARAAIDALLRAGFDREGHRHPARRGGSPSSRSDRRRTRIPRAVSPDVDSHVRARRVQAPDASRRGRPCRPLRDHGADETPRPAHRRGRHPAPARGRVRRVLRPMGVRGASRHRADDRRRTSRHCSRGRGTTATPTRSPRCSTRMPNS